MSQPVWVLSVDLQTKTATFQSGLADAARTARTSFQDIKGGATEMGGAVGRSSGEARHAVMMLGEEFGIHLPRGVTSFIASLGPVNSAMEMAFPFIAISAGAAVLLEHLRKVREEAEKSAQEEARFGTTIQTTFNALDEKMLEAEKRADELREDHLGALAEELKLIDKQSLDDIAGQFEKLAGAADKTLQTLKADWFQFGSGSTGASHALSDFQTQYEALLAQGKGAQASDLLSGTLYSAKVILADMNTIRSESTALNSGKTQSQISPAERQAAAQALNALKAAGVTWTDKELQAQQTLVQLLQGQVGVEARINALKSVDKGNAIQQTQKDIKADALRQADAEREGRDLYIRELLETGNQERQVYEQSIRDMIDSTKEGTAERLEAIRQGMHEEEQAGLEGTEFYQRLGTEQTQVIRSMAEQQAKLKAEYDREIADNDEKMAELSLARLKESAALTDSARRVSQQQRVNEELAFAEMEYQIKLQAAQRETAALDALDTDYLAKLKAAQDKEKQLTIQHENEIAAIKDKAAIASNQRILSAYQQFVNATAQQLTASIMGHQTWARTLQTLGNQVVTGMLENAIKSVMLDDFDKERDAAKAARKFFLAGSQLPFPANIIAAPVLAAGAFAAVMAFEQGTDRVPGAGRGDIVPALLSPGEGVVPGGVMDGLRDMARNGGFQSHAPVYATAHFAPHIHAMDADGVDAVLTKHATVFQRHFEGTLRRMNR